MPYFNCPELVSRAVASVLSQTVDVHLILVADGCQVPKLYGIDDSRLTVFQMPENRGRYFVDAMVFEATSNYRWFAIHDSDDWSEPRWLESLMEANLDGVALPGTAYLGSERRKMWHINKPLGSGMVHLAYHCGLYARERIIRAGGWNPSFRVGYDTLLGNLLRMTGEVGYSMDPLYHISARPGSLTRDPETGMGSPYRKAQTRLLEDLYRRAFLLYSQGRIDEIPHVIAQSTDPPLRAEVLEQANALRRVIA